MESTLVRLHSQKQQSIFSLSTLSNCKIALICIACATAATYGLSRWYRFSRLFALVPAALALLIIPRSARQIREKATAALKEEHESPIYAGYQIGKGNGSAPSIDDHNLLEGEDAFAFKLGAHLALPLSKRYEEFERLYKEELEGGPQISKEGAIALFKKVRWPLAIEKETIDATTVALAYEIVWRCYKPGDRPALLRYLKERSNEEILADRAFFDFLGQSSVAEAPREQLAAALDLLRTAEDVYDGGRSDRIRTKVRIMYDVSDQPVIDHLNYRLRDRLATLLAKTGVHFLTEEEVEGALTFEGEAPQECGAKIESALQRVEEAYS